jgi:hypothetical protein
MRGNRDGSTASGEAVTGENPDPEIRKRRSRAPLQLVEKPAVVADLEEIPRFGPEEMGAQKAWIPTASVASVPTRLAIATYKGLNSRRSFTQTEGKTLGLHVWPVGAAREQSNDQSWVPRHG